MEQPDFSPNFFSFKADIEQFQRKVESHLTPRERRNEIMKEQREVVKEIHRRRSEISKENYRKHPFPRREKKVKPPPQEYVIVKNWKGQNVRIKRVNSMRVGLRNYQKRRRILKTLHNSDMSTTPKDSLEQPYDMEYASSDQNLPRNIQRKVDHSSFNDVEPIWRSEDPRKRLSWKEFCEDFLGQNYGSIAQSMLEVYQQDKALFLKYAMEMGKQTLQQHVNVDVQAQVKSTGDIYAQLQALANASAIPLNPQQVLPCAEQETTPAEVLEEEQDIVETTAVEEVDPEEDTCGCTEPMFCMTCPKHEYCSLPVCHYAHEMNTPKPNHNE